MKEKCILIGVTGGIAAYKTCSLVSSLKKKGYEVHVLMSANAQKFVTPLTFQTLSAQRVITDMFATDYEPDVHHISLAKKADLFVIAPASADVIAKVANGLADDILTTTFLASTCAKLIVPAMNTNMLANPATQENLARCRRYGIHVMEADSGYLACGDIGKGRMPEAEEIEDMALSLLESDRFLSGRHVLVSAGPTQEALDPVRYLTNHSSGKMGYAIARAARNAGADVTLVAGPNVLLKPAGVRLVSVISAQEMADAVLAESAAADVIVMAAAVADYTPAVKEADKIHKAGDMSLKLVRTTDILAALGQQKKPHQTLIGFAMETKDLLRSARRKLQEKNCDYIIANNLNVPGAGFQKDTNQVTILSADGESQLSLMSKDETARNILEYCLKGKKE